MAFRHGHLVLYQHTGERGPRCRGDGRGLKGKQSMVTPFPHKQLFADRLNDYDLLFIPKTTP